MMKQLKTYFDKVWEEHKIKTLDNGDDLLFIDRHLLHEVSSPQAFSGLKASNRKISSPELTFATTDHIVSTEKNRSEKTVEKGEELILALRENCKTNKITHFDIHDKNQGIVHIIAPELGLVLPSMMVVCGDSHTCTLGGLGAIAWGIGTSEVEHTLATQTIKLKKPKNMLIEFIGLPKNQYVSAKDVILYALRKLGVSSGLGYAIEYQGNYITNLEIEGRLTICNLSIELGARIGIIAPDMKTFRYIKDKLYTPDSEEILNKAICYWKSFYTDDIRAFDKIHKLDIENIVPQVTWGTLPEHVTDISGFVPDPTLIFDTSERIDSAKRALEYMDLKPGKNMRDISLDYVFIGSCTNGRLSDIRAAAKVVKGKQVNHNVHAIVVPGSMQVKHQAELEGLDKILIDAGFEWRAPGCSMCVSVNADKVPPGKRCLSTSNRNFQGRQGPGSRTHLASPTVAAASAIRGFITSPEEL